MAKITEVRVTYPSPQGLMTVKEVLGPKVRLIEFDPGFPGFILHVFDATDGSVKPRYLNLATCMWFEMDHEKEDVSPSV